MSDTWVPATRESAGHYAGEPTVAELEAEIAALRAALERAQAECAELRAGVTQVPY